MTEEEEAFAAGIRAAKSAFIEAIATVDPADLTTQEFRMLTVGTPFRFVYENYRGEIAVRSAIPLRIRYGTNLHYPAPAWFLVAYDLSRKAVRDFRMDQIQPVEEKA